MARRKGVAESAGVGHVSAVGEEREAKRGDEESAYAGKEQRHSRPWEEGMGQRNWGGKCSSDFAPISPLTLFLC